MQPTSPAYVYCDGCGYLASANARFCGKCGASLAGALPAALPANAPNISLSSPAAPAQPPGLDRGRYIDIAPLSDRGGMGLVFRARDTNRSNQPCVIKQLRPEPDLDQAMFEREATLLTLLRHPALPACWDFFSEQGSFFLVSELIEGLALQDMIEQRGPASEQDVLRWGIDLCDALVYIHSQQPPIVHRDLKPDNVIITPEGSAVLVDFGIARRYEAGRRDTMKMGTWGYLPPEQKAGQTEPRSDLYALGGTLSFALTNNDPQMLNLIDINLQWRQGISFPPVRAANPQVSAELEAILLRATCVAVEERYPSARAMLDELHNLQSASKARRGTTPIVSVPAPVAAPPPQTWPTFRGSMARAGAIPTALYPPLKVIWNFQAQDAIDGSPILCDGVIYVASRDKRLYALDAQAQRELWRYTADASVRSTPTLHGDTLFFGDDDGMLHAVQASGGQGRWRIPLRGKVFASAAAGGGLILVATQAGRLVALTPTGGESIWEHFDGTPFYASPAVLNNLVIIANGPGQVKGLEITSGKLLWSFQASGPVRATPTCHDGLALVAGLDGSLALLDARSGERLWQRSLGSPISASPILTGENIFAAGQDGALFALSRDTGSRLWTTRTSGQIAASPVCCGSSLLVIDNDGTISLIAADSGKAGFQLALGAAVFASSAVSGKLCVVGTRQGGVVLLEGQA